MTGDEPICDYVARGTVERLTAERDTSRAWSQSWKAEAKRGRRGSIDLLVAVCQRQEVINELLAERDTAQRHLELLALETTRRLNEMADTQDRYESERDDALADAARLRAALEWYADEDNYLCRSYAEGLGGLSLTNQDGGERAQRALGDGQGDAKR